MKITYWITVVLALSLIPTSSQALSKVELKCASKMPKASSTPWIAWLRR